MTISKIDKARTEFATKAQAAAREGRQLEALAAIKNNADLAQKIYKSRCKVGRPEYFLFTNDDALLMMHCIDANSWTLATRALLAAKQLKEDDDASPPTD